MSSNINSFFQLTRHPVQFRMFLFSKLPSAYFAGVRIKEMDENSCRVTVPYKWFTRNPFRSTYFACLSMAAEMSTGALALGYVYERKPAVSLLVVKVESEYFKKAVDKTTFICIDGALIKQAIEDAVQTNEAKTVRARSIGKNKAGEVVAEFFITWSSKVRNK